MGEPAGEVLEFVALLNDADVARLRARNRRRLWRFVLLPCLLVLAGLAMARAGVLGLAYLMYALAGAFGLFIGVPLVRFLVLSRRMRRAASDGGAHAGPYRGTAAEGHKPVQYRFDETGFTTRGGFGAGDYGWEQVSNVDLANDPFAVTTAGTSLSIVHLIPRRALDAPSLARFEALVARARPRFVNVAQPKPNVRHGRRALVLWIVMILAAIAVFNVMTTHPRAPARGSNR
jgi:hypothetical protein